MNTLSRLLQTMLRPLQRTARFGLGATALSMLATSSAFASSTVGSSISSVTTNINPTITLLSYASYILGSMVLVRGLIMLSQHTSQPERVPFSHVVYHFIGATLLATLPIAFGLVQRTLGLNATGGVTKSAAALSGGGPTMSLDVMLINFVTNIKGPMYLLLTSICVILGIFLLVTGFLRIAKNGGQDGPRSSLGGGTIMRIVVGAVLLSIGTTSDIFTTTIFGGSVVSFTGLNPALGLAPDLTKINQAISAGLVFFQIIGFISFVRGFLMLKAIADGSQGASTAAAFTHIFGGAVAFNISPALQALQNTFGITTPVMQFS